MYIYWIDSDNKVYRHNFNCEAIPCKEDLVAIPLYWYSEEEDKKLYSFHKVTRIVWGLNENNVLEAHVGTYGVSIDYLFLPTKNESFPLIEV